MISVIVISVIIISVTMYNVPHNAPAITLRYYYEDNSKQFLLTIIQQFSRQPSNSLTFFQVFHISEHPATVPEH